MYVHTSDEEADSLHQGPVRCTYSGDKRERKRKTERKIEKLVMNNNKIDQNE